jgi:hypothetical protein
MTLGPVALAEYDVVAGLDPAIPAAQVAERPAVSAPLRRVRSGRGG